MKGRLIFFLSLLPLHPTFAYIQHSLSSSLICLTGWQRLGLNSRECQKKHPVLYLDGLGEGTENNYGILFGWIEGKSGNFPFWPFDKNKLKSFLSLHPHYYGIHLFYWTHFMTFEYETVHTIDRSGKQIGLNYSNSSASVNQFLPHTASRPHQIIQCRAATNNFLCEMNLLIIFLINLFTLFGLKILVNQQIFTL